VTYPTRTSRANEERQRHEKMVLWLGHRVAARESEVWKEASCGRYGEKRGHERRGEQKERPTRGRMEMKEREGYDNHLIIFIL